MDDWSSALLRGALVFLAVWLLVFGLLGQVLRPSRLAPAGRAAANRPGRCLCSGVHSLALYRYEQGAVGTSEA